MDLTSFFNNSTKAPRSALISDLIQSCQQCTSPRGITEKAHSLTMKNKKLINSAVGRYNRPVPAIPTGSFYLAINPPLFATSIRADKIKPVDLKLKGGLYLMWKV